MVRLTTYDRGEITVHGLKATIPANTDKTGEILHTTSGEQAVLIVNISAIYDICRFAVFENACGNENVQNLYRCFSTLLREYTLPNYYILSGDIIVREADDSTTYKSAVDLTITEAINLLGDIVNEIPNTAADHDIAEYGKHLYLCQKAWDEKRLHQKQ